MGDLFFILAMKEIILTLLKAEMPPGWRKAVNSGTLMESFARVDKYRWSPERSNIATRCGACSQARGDITLRTSAVADMIVDIVKNIDCQRYSRDQLVNVLVKLKCLAKHEQGWIIVFSLNNIRFMIDPESERCLVLRVKGWGF